MSAQITVTKDDEIALIKVTGKPTMQEILDVNIGLAEGGDYVVKNRLWDFRESQVAFSTAELVKIAELNSQLGRSYHKTAILVGNDLAFGLSRMYQVFREADNTHISVFRDESEALRWLLAD